MSHVLRAVCVHVKSVCMWRAVRVHVMMPIARCNTYMLPGRCK